MPIRGHLGSGEIYHVLNRGAGKQDIFRDEADYLRFVLGLYCFNDKNGLPPGSVPHYFQQFLKTKGADAVLQSIDREPMVELLAFCLMPNHYHLLMRQNAENGISAFMNRLNGGYSRYFNGKYDQTGTLFQGRYKAVHVANGAHMLHLPYYIHLNPLDLQHPEWRKRELGDKKAAQAFLNNYRWSSHLDYIGEHNFPSATNRRFLLEVFGGPKEYDREIWNWLNDFDFFAHPARDLFLEN